MVFLQRCVHSMVVLIAALCTPTLVWGALQSGGVTANDPGAPMTYALVVGINSYRVLPVKGAVPDAEAVRARLTNESLGLIRREDSIFLLEQEADGAALDAALEDLLRRADANDIVIFFWAGRSEYDVFADDLFLFPFDAQFHPNGALKSGEYSLRRRVLARAADFPGRFVFIGDSCGGFSEESLKVDNVTLLTSAQPNENAIEGVFGHGLFTFHLLNALDRPRTDRDQDGRISLGEVYDALYQRVVDDSDANQHTGLIGADPQTVMLARAVSARDAGARPTEPAAAGGSPDLVKPRPGARVTAALASLHDAPPLDALLPTVRNERRHALVVGNGAYVDRVRPLPNPQHDAEDMAAKLEEAGFEVTLAVNLDRSGMERAIVEFGKALQEGGIGLFYYAGHAVQLNGKNYLIPIGAKVGDEDWLPLDTIDADDVLWRMGGADNRLNIVILDSCRDNPFPSSFRSISRGLAPLPAPHGTFVAYAAAPGARAIDGLGGRNSPFTAALLKTVDDSGLKLEDVFKRVTAIVSERTQGFQHPWVHSSITGDFYFHPPASEPEPTEVAADPSLADRPDYLAWKAIEGSRQEVDYRTFIDAFPNSPLVPFAKGRLRSRGAQ